MPEFSRELGILEKLRHPNILSFFGAVSEGNHRAIVIERAAMDVYSQLQKYGALSSAIGVAKLNMLTRVRYGNAPCPPSPLPISLSTILK